MIATLLSDCVVAEKSLRNPIPSNPRYCSVFHTLMTDPLVRGGIVQRHSESNVHVHSIWYDGIPLRHYSYCKAQRDPKTASTIYSLTHGSMHENTEQNLRFYAIGFCKLMKYLFFRLKHCLFHFAIKSNQSLSCSNRGFCNKTVINIQLVIVVVAVISN